MIARGTIRRGAAALVCLGVAAVAWGCGTSVADGSGAPAPASVAADPGVKRVAGANTDFGLRMLRRLTGQRPTGNVFFSPFSISSALTMTLNGAGGRTGRDMAKTLGLAAMTTDQVNRANGLLLPSLSRPDPKVQVSVANALWAGRGVTLSSDFQARCWRFYDAHAARLDFSSPAAADTINGWVRSHTHDKITHLVSHDDIIGATAVLTNAVYFHGKWQTPFDKSATRSEPFHATARVSRAVPMMRQDGEFLYSETARLQAVSLPYGGGRMSLYALMPKPGQTADGLVKSLDAAAWDARIATMKPTYLALSLPRFKADDRESLREPLSALGMASAFGRGADFGPMGLRDAQISDVIHQAVLDVDEEGTVAAAATGVIVVQSAARRPPQTVMRVDRPFFCAIRDNVTGTLLFAGVIRDPH